MDIQDKILSRDASHGKFAVRAEVAQNLKRVFERAPNWAKLDDVHKQALEAAADNLSRILAGDPNLPQHWEDVAGYMIMASQRTVAPVSFRRDTTVAAKEDN